MQYIHRYRSPLGVVLLTADEEGLTGLWFEEQRHPNRFPERAGLEKAAPVFDETADWLDLYFSGREPDFLPPLHFTGTPFQNEVWGILREIPYGHTVTYGEIAALLAKRRGLRRMSAQAVGGAVGRNRIAIMVPCHRVVGANGNLTGYAGGLDRKRFLLRLEGIDTGAFFMPGTPGKRPAPEEAE